MGIIRGQLAYEKFERGERLTRKQAIEAQCYQCNGFEDSNEDCRAYDCSLYQFHPHKNKYRESR